MSAWPLVTVGSVTSRVTKGTTPTTLGATFRDAGINFVKVESLLDGRIDHGKVAYIDESTHALLKRSVVELGDLLFSIAGTIGRVAKVQNYDLPANTNRAVAIIRPDLELVDRDFLYYCLREDSRIAKAQSRVVQSVQQNLSLAELSNVEIPRPPIEEQRSIAATLGALDDKIESNRRASKLIDQVVDAMAANFLNLEDEITELSDVVEFNSTKVSPGPPDAELLYVDIASVSPGTVGALTPISWSEAPSRARRGIADGDVIYSTVRPGRRSFAQILEPDSRAVASTGFAVMTPTARIGSSMLTTVASTLEFAEYLESVAHGSAYPAVSIQAMGAFKVRLPSSAAIVEFERRTMPLRRKSHQAKAECERLAALRDALLPELLSGRMRVPETCA